jgi:glutaredoxin 3
MLTPRGLVVLYAAPFCAECERARALLERRGIAFEEIELSADPERRFERVASGPQSPDSPDP